jgi:hypothetical protein
VSPLAKAVGSCFKMTPDIRIPVSLPDWSSYSMIRPLVATAPPAAPLSEKR